MIMKFIVIQNRLRLCRYRKITMAFLENIFSTILLESIFFLIFIIKGTLFILFNYFSRILRNMAIN